jgi:hypothetical protein
MNARAHSFADGRACCWCGAKREAVVDRRASPFCAEKPDELVERDNPQPQRAGWTGY